MVTRVSSRALDELQAGLMLANRSQAALDVRHQPRLVEPHSCHQLVGERCIVVYQWWLTALDIVRSVGLTTIGVADFEAMPIAFRVQLLRSHSCSLWAY